MTFKRHWRWWLLMAALAVGGLGGATWLQLDAAPADIAGNPVRAASVAAQASAATTADSGRRAPVRPSANTSHSDQRLRVAAAATSAPIESAEICGVATLTEAEFEHLKADSVRGRATANEIMARMQRHAEAGVARIAARLAAGNERQQVAARLLMNDREGAAMLAERSSDALTYQLALTACAAAQEGAPHCARLSPRRWAELDPNDARPWLRLMAEASRRKDAAGMDAALAEAAARSQLSRGDFLLEAQAVAVADAVPDATELGRALVPIIGIDAAMQGLDVAAPMKLCSGEGLRDSARLATCRTLARQLLANASSLIDAMLAQRLAERAGVPREQQAFDAATLQAAQTAYQEGLTTDLDMSCATVRRFGQFSVERAASGELALALAWLQQRDAASGPSR